MLRIASHLQHWVTDRRRPSCGCVEVFRSARKRSHFYPFYLLGPSDAKTAAIAFMASRSNEKFRSCAIRKRSRTWYRICRFWFTDVRMTKTLSRGNQRLSVKLPRGTHHACDKSGARPTTHSDKPGHRGRSAEASNIS